MQKLCLSELKKGDQAWIVGFTTTEIPVKLYDMGLIPGSKFIVYKKAPFKGPVCISVGNEECLMALRSNEADIVLVEKV
jgi:ferrous iron transport protein A